MNTGTRVVQVVILTRRRKDSLGPVDVPAKGKCSIARCPQTGRKWGAARKQREDCDAGGAMKQLVHNSTVADVLVAPRLYQSASAPYATRSPSSERSSTVESKSGKAHGVPCQCNPWHQLERLYVLCGHQYALVPARPLYQPRPSSMRRVHVQSASAGGAAATRKLHLCRHKVPVQWHGSDLRL